jgi:TatD DNase family protein
LIDSHVHLNSERFAADRDAVIGRAREAGLTGYIVPGYDLASSLRAVALARTSELAGKVFATVGLHPHEAARWPEDGPALRALAAEPGVVALGEMGLDFYRNLSSPEEQRRAFSAQLDLAAELGKPVVIHDRDAHEAVLDLLGPWSERVAAENRLDRPFGVMHCFSGDLALARRCTDLGLLISIAGPVTYPASGALAEVARVLPLEDLILETDAPYLPPQPWRGRRNEPAYLRFTAESVADLRGIALATLAEATAQNARRLFRLPVAVGGVV